MSTISLEVQNSGPTLNVHISVISGKSLIIKKNICDDKRNAVRKYYAIDALDRPKRLPNHKVQMSKIGPRILY